MGRPGTVKQCHGAGTGQGPGCFFAAASTHARRLAPPSSILAEQPWRCQGQGLGTQLSPRAPARSGFALMPPKQIQLQVSVGFQREKHADRSGIENPVLGGTCEGASMNQPGAKWILAWRLVSCCSSLLSQAKQAKENDLNCIRAFWRESKPCLIIEHKGGLSRMVFISNRTSSEILGLL